MASSSTNPLGIDILGDSSYVDTIGPLHCRGGYNPSTHLANVRYPSQAAPVISVVKFLPYDDNGGIKVCNEAMAVLFLRAAGMRTPGHAAIMLLSEKLAARAISRKEVSQFAHNGWVLAWATERLPHSSLQVAFAGSQADSEWLNMLTTSEGASIAAFDEVFQNCDRNTGNVLFINASQCVPIDHEALFNNQLWHNATPKDMGECHAIRTLHKGLLTGQLSPRQHRETSSRIIHAAERHAEAIEKCKHQIEHLLSSIYQKDSPQAADHVLSFVTERSATGWMSNRLGTFL